MINDIEIVNATVSYRENIALRNITLAIPKGSFTAVVGPNGAGKTTLLTLINGLGRLQRGEVRIFGTRLGRSTAARIRQDIGYVPQVLDMDRRMPMSTYDVVMLGRCSRIGIFRNPGKEDHRIAEEICERVGITHLRKKPVGHLSGGESQKASLARALAQEPRILLLDEPTANLDPRAQCEIAHLVTRVHEERGLTVLFVTHLISDLPSACTHAVLLKQGRIAVHGTMAAVFTGENLSHVYEHPVETPVAVKEALRV